MPEFYMILVRKISKIAEFLLYLPEKLTKFPNCTWFCPKSAWILHNNCTKNIFRECFSYGPLAGLRPPQLRVLRGLKHGTVSIFFLFSTLISEVARSIVTKLCRMSDADRNLPLVKKLWRPKNIKISDFSLFYCKYLRNAIRRCSRTENGVARCDQSRTCVLN